VVFAAFLEGVSIPSNSSISSATIVRSDGLPCSFSSGTSFGPSFRLAIDDRFPGDFVISGSSGLVLFVDVGVLGGGRGPSLARRAFLSPSSLAQRKKLHCSSLLLGHLQTAQLS